MKEVIYSLMDIVNYLMQGILLVFFLESAEARFHFRIKNMTEIILAVQYMAVQLFLHTSDSIKTLLFGQTQIMSDSRQSIILVVVSLCITYFICIGALRESKLKVFYYVVTFYAVIELVRFTFYTMSLKILDAFVNLNVYLCIEKGVYGTEAFFMAASIIEAVWNVLMITAVLFVSCKIILQMKEYLSLEDEYQKSELIYLLLPSGIGLLVCLIIRSVLFSINGSDIELLLDIRPEMILGIPCISVLCIAMIILSAKMLKKLMLENERKIEVSIYQSRLKELEQHIEDIESLYAGIRGMKHDMKNYIADMDALMKSGTGDATNQTALKQYLNSLQISVEQLDMKYNTGNPITDVIIQRYVQLTHKMNIAFEVDFIYPDNMNIDAFDLSIIINNALDNAVEACLKQKNENRYVELTAHRRENVFFVIVRNSFDGKLTRNKANGQLVTSKKDTKNHGLGMRNIELCAEKYYGKAEIIVKNSVFELAVMLQKREQEVES